MTKDNVISYRTGTNKGKERGFLSFEGAVAPASLFLKLYFPYFFYLMVKIHKMQID